MKQFEGREDLDLQATINFFRCRLNKLKNKRKCFLGVLQSLKISIILVTGYAVANFIQAVKQLIIIYVKKRFAVIASLTTATIAFCFII